MTRLEALKSYTINAAYGAFEENIKGSIEIGKYADFTVLSQNIITVPEDQILNTKVRYTIINGQIEYKANWLVKSKVNEFDLFIRKSIETSIVSL